MKFPATQQNWMSVGAELCSTARDDTYLHVDVGLLLLDPLLQALDTLLDLI